MSAEATFWAWGQVGISSTDKLVLLCLANCHNPDTGRCDPGAKYLSEKTELNIKTIPLALHRLEEFGLITIKRRPGHTPDYFLHINQKWDTPKTGSPKNGVTQKQTPVSPKTGEGDSPKTGDKTKRETKKNLKIYNVDESLFPIQLNLNSWQEWVDYRQTISKNMSAKAAEKQIVFLCAYDQQTQKQIIDKSIANDWSGLFPLCKRVTARVGQVKTRDRNIVADLTDRSWAY